uniref:Uncharacterized protein n=1 Tax=Ditylenchus dipsaci TaxID=166011 RepID=A0A915D1C3_9BILA
MKPLELAELWVLLFTDEIFQRVIYSATERHTIADSVERFFSMVAIPPGKCNPEARWQPKETEDVSWFSS